MHRPTAGDAHLQSVWDEPGLSSELSGLRPADAMRYADWLAWGIRHTSWRRSWFVTFAAALAAGPLAVFGTLFTSLVDPRHSIGILGLVFVAPVVEEIMKAAAALWIAEVRPFRFKSWWQVILCLLCAGFGFAVIENLLYLYLYVPDASQSLIVWRWTVCVALHVVCSGVAGIGVARVWRAALRKRRPPAVALAGPMLAAAAIGHGSYNALMVILELTGYTF